MCLPCIQLPRLTAIALTRSHLMREIFSFRFLASSSPFAGMVILRCFILISTLKNHFHSLVMQFDVSIQRSVWCISCRPTADDTQMLALNNVSIEIESMCQLRQYNDRTKQEDGEEFEGNNTKVKVCLVCCDYEWVCVCVSTYDGAGLVIRCVNRSTHQFGSENV